MIVCDQRIIDLLRQITEAVAWESRRARIADQRIAQQTGMGRLHQDAGVAKVTNAHAGAFKLRTGSRRLSSKQGGKHLSLIVLDSERIGGVPGRLWRVLHLEQLIEPWMVERQLEPQARAGVQPRRTEDEGTLVPFGQREC